jgi:hypothetical protein
MNCTRPDYWLRAERAADYLAVTAFVVLALLCGAGLAALTNG